MAYWLSQNGAVQLATISMEQANLYLNLCNLARPREQLPSLFARSGSRQRPDIAGGAGSEQQRDGLVLGEILCRHEEAARLAEGILHRLIQGRLLVDLALRLVTQLRPGSLRD